MTEEKDLIKLSELHAKLVQGLKSALLISQFGFLEAGKFLYKISSAKTYLAEDFSRKVTFTEFLQRSDLPIPGHTRESRLRIAQKLIRIYKFFLIDRQFNEKKLAPIGYSKLDMLIPVIKVHEEEAEKWLDKAILLTVEDLRKEILQKDKTLTEILDCPHKNITKVTFWECQECHTRWNSDPQEKLEQENPETNAN